MVSGEQPLARTESITLDNDRLFHLYGGSCGSCLSSTHRNRLLHQHRRGHVPGDEPGSRPLPKPTTIILHCPALSDEKSSDDCFQAFFDDTHLA